ncbi:MAG: hypothetical protein KBT45_08445 [Bacteroidales bacterium]|nr:hypothetical protein [Candidatus Colimorpha pelethequi]MCQ2261628.1 hypothetical protein [Bacteroidales bacterium]
MAKRPTLVEILGGDFLKKKSVMKQIPLLLLILVYALVVVSNRYRVEKLVKDKEATKERVEFLREHKIMMQKKYQETIKISKIAEDLDTIGIGLTAGPPFELTPIQPDKKKRKR